ncbi:MAG TPA: tetratricopeptide repeat protein [Flavisolibacter sp.]
MSRVQWITIGIAVLLVLGIYAATQRQLFGEPKRADHPHASAPAAPELSIDTILAREKSGLTATQVTRLEQLERDASGRSSDSSRIHAFHQLAKFWSDTAREIAPYAWYTAEAARLENSEKSLTFAARLFLAALKDEPDADLKRWEASQAKDLLERSLRVNPQNDSTKVFLGEVYVYGGIAMPMEGIAMIRQVADADPKNLQAQFALAEASLVSGQTDKAIERFRQIAAIDPSQLRATLRLGEIYEQRGDKASAIEWYEKSLPHTNRIEGLRAEVERRINLLKTNN